MHGIGILYYYTYAVRSLQRVSHGPIFNDTWCILFLMLLAVCINAVINLRLWIQCDVKLILVLIYFVERA